MKLAHYSVKRLKKEVLAIIDKHIDNRAAYEVFFFGSRVSGHSDERSDIDIGIEGKKPVPLSALANIREELEELPILYRIDIVDFQRVSDEFKAIAAQSKELIG